MRTFYFDMYYYSVYSLCGAIVRFVLRFLTKFFWFHICQLLKDAREMRLIEKTTFLRDEGY